MGKSKGLAGSHLIPMPPVIYIHDLSRDKRVAQGLSELIPNAVLVDLGTYFDAEKYLNDHAKDRKKLRCTNPVYIMVEHRRPNDRASRKSMARDLRQYAVKIGCNFASIDTYSETGYTPKAWGGNHLDLCIPESSINTLEVDVKEYAEKIYKWLFTVLTIKDTVHLITDEEMHENNEDFSLNQYQYCTVADSLDQKKDAKIYLIAMIVTKPEVVSENLIKWQVADRTGLAECVFKYYDAKCVTTWDWILTLQPGQRRSLPLMKSVLVKEKPLVTVLKAPLRIPGAFLKGAGLTVGFVGVAVSLLGEAMMMGKRKQWVLEHDVKEHLSKNKGTTTVPPSEAKSETKPTKTHSSIKVFTEKGEKAWDEKTWDDKDSSCGSTLTDDSVAETVAEKVDKVDTKLDW